MFSSEVIFHVQWSRMTSGKCENFSFRPDLKIVFPYTYAKHKDCQKALLKNSEFGRQNKLFLYRFLYKTARLKFKSPSSCSDNSFLVNEVIILSR